jgi:hypothetical protein
MINAFLCLTLVLAILYFAKNRAISHGMVFLYLLVLVLLLSYLLPKRTTPG